MHDITEKVCKWKRLVLHFWSWNSMAAHGPFVWVGLSGASAHKRKCLWSYSNRRIKSAVWWLGWHICLAVMKISPLMVHSVIGLNPPDSTSCLFILHTSGRQIAARGILPQPLGVCVCAELSTCHFEYTADVYDRVVCAAFHKLISLCKSEDFKHIKHYAEWHALRTS